MAFADGNRDEVDFTSVSEDVEDLVRRLCRRDPLQRLCGDELEAHAFFVCPVEDIRCPELVCRGRRSRVPTRVNLHSVWSTCWIWRPEIKYGDNVPSLPSA